MGTCEVCGNQYDKTFEVRLENDTAAHTFDSFECAIMALAPRCDHCGVRIIGHGVEAANGAIFCCAHCAERKGVTSLKDRTHETA